MSTLLTHVHAAHGVEQALQLQNDSVSQGENESWEVGRGLTIYQLDLEANLQEATDGKRRATAKPGEMGKDPQKEDHILTMTALGQRTPFSQSRSQGRANIWETHAKGMKYMYLYDVQKSKHNQFRNKAANRSQSTMACFLVYSWVYVCMLGYAYKHQKNIQQTLDHVFLWKMVG